MNALKTYDYLVQARGKVFAWTRPLSQEQYERVFPIGFGSLARTLTHIMICEVMYVRRIAGETVPPYSEWIFQDETPPPFAALEAAWRAQAQRTREVLASVRDWMTDLEYTTTSDSGKRSIINASPSDIFSQLAMHEVHHRAQAMNMLKQLGVKLEDIDFNELMYKRRPA